MPTPILSALTRRDYLWLAIFDQDRTISSRPLPIPAPATPRSVALARWHAPSGDQPGTQCGAGRSAGERGGSKTWREESQTRIPSARSSGDYRTDFPEPPRQQQQQQLTEGGFRNGGPCAGSTTAIGPPPSRMGEILSPSGVVSAPMGGGTVISATGGNLGIATPIGSVHHSRSGDQRALSGVAVGGHHYVLDQAAQTAFQESAAAAAAYVSFAEKESRRPCTADAGLSTSTVDAISDGTSRDLTAKRRCWSAKAAGGCRRQLSVATQYLNTSLFHPEPPRGPFRSPKNGGEAAEEALNSRAFVAADAATDRRGFLTAVHRGVCAAGTPLLKSSRPARNGTLPLRDGGTTNIWRPFAGGRDREGGVILSSRPLSAVCARTSGDPSPRRTGGPGASRRQQGKPVVVASPRREVDWHASDMATTPRTPSSFVPLDTSTLQGGNDTQSGTFHQHAQAHKHQHVAWRGKGLGGLASTPDPRRAMYHVGDKKQGSADCDSGIDGGQNNQSSPCTPQTPPGTSSTWIRQQHAELGTAAVTAAAMVPPLPLEKLSHIERQRASPPSQAHHESISLEDTVLAAKRHHRQRRPQSAPVRGLPPHAEHEHNANGPVLPPGCISCRENCLPAEQRRYSVCSSMGGVRLLEGKSSLGSISAGGAGIGGAVRRRRRPQSAHVLGQSSHGEPTCMSPDASAGGGGGASHDRQQYGRRPSSAPITGTLSRDIYVSRRHRPGGDSGGTYLGGGGALLLGSEPILQAELETRPSVSSDMLELLSARPLAPRLPASRPLSARTAKIARQRLLGNDRVTPREFDAWAGGVAAQGEKWMLPTREEVVRWGRDIDRLLRSRARGQEGDAMMAVNGQERFKEG